MDSRKRAGSLVLFFPRHITGISYLLQALTEPFSYITANPGKEIRGRMIQAFNEWLKVPQENVAIIGKVVNMLHSASLL